MQFGAIPVAEAQGAILAHSLMVAGRRLAKGTWLDESHVAHLRKAGVETVTVARLEAGDIEENTAAMRLATALAPDAEALGLRVSAAGAGRVNLYAMGPGVVQLDIARIHRLNAVDAMITTATLPDLMRGDPGTMVATIKIISYAVPDAALAQASRDMGGAIAIRPPQFKTATMIETSVPDMPKSGKGRAAMAERMQRLGVSLTDPVLVPHAEADLANAIAAAEGEVIFILTASATSDMHDIAPSALRVAGGSVTRYGLPVDPGNLLFFGTCAGKPVIGLPGCARSPALNGADWVLERLICGLELTQADIAQMGVGGLLKEIPTRPRPRNRKYKVGD